MEERDGSNGVSHAWPRTGALTFGLRRKSRILHRHIRGHVPDRVEFDLLVTDATGPFGFAEYQTRISPMLTTLLPKASPEPIRGWPASTAAATYNAFS
jgi:hypothetical protein